MVLKLAKFGKTVSFTFTFTNNIEVDMSTQVIARQQANKRQAMGKLSDSYRTPGWLINWLDDEYDFDFDICASDENHLFDRYYTESNPYNGKDWSEMGSIGFCNPPFSHGSKEEALSNAYRNMIDNGVSSVFLIPSDVSNRFWRTHILGKATKITVIVGRVKFNDPLTGEESKGALGCAVVEFMFDEPSVNSIDYFVDRDEIKAKYETKRTS
jgi:phage N-6-adenine-methyltransferase